MIYYVSNIGSIICMWLTFERGTLIPPHHRAPGNKIANKGPTSTAVADGVPDWNTYMLFCSIARWGRLHTTNFVPTGPGTQNL